MIKLKNKLLGLLVFMFLYCFAQNSFAGSVLIEGNNSSMDNLLYTKCFDGKPVLIFSDDLIENKTSVLDKVEAILFQDSSYEDLAIELSDYISIAPFATSSVVISQEGIYELWLDGSGIEKDNKELPLYKIKIDNIVLPLTYKETLRKFIHIGDLKLKPGKHSLQIISDKKDANISNLKLVLVNSEQRKAAEELLHKKVSDHATELSYVIESEKRGFLVNHQGNARYNFKLSLEPVIFESVTYWQGKEAADWDVEIKNWRYGLLDDKITPPFILKLENLLLEKENNREIYADKGQNIRILAFNPLNAQAKASFNFSAKSANKNIIMAIALNKNFLKRIEVSPEEKFKDFSLNLVLVPGINEISLFFPEDAASQKPEALSKAADKTMNIIIEEFSLRFIQAITSPKKVASLNAEKAISQRDYLDIALPSDEPMIFSRDINVNLEEFPLFKIDAEFKRKTEARLVTVLGIDYTDDATIDDYIRLENTGEHNIFRLAKQMWQKEGGKKINFVLRKIILLSLDNYGAKNKGTGSLVVKLKKINSYNNSSLILTENRDFNKLLKLEDLNAKSQLTEKAGGVEVLCDFSTGLQQALPQIYNQFGEEESVGARIFLPIAAEGRKDFPYFSFDYKLEDASVQGLSLGMLVRDKGKESVVGIPESKYVKTDKEIEINLQDLFAEASGAKGLVILLSRKKADKQPPKASSRYLFSFNNFQFYNKFPFPIKSKGLKKKFLTSLLSLSPAVKIDDSYFKLRDFSGADILGDSDANMLSKVIELSGGYHKFEKLNNGAFSVKWAILEPTASRKNIQANQKTSIVFKKINPTKYLVKVAGASKPFWLVFSEGFNGNWKLYEHKTFLKGRLASLLHDKQAFDDIVADYPVLAVRESRHEVAFTPQDVKLLFEKPLGVAHYAVNGYANGWYIEPNKLGLGSDFVLTIYFLPQSYFYLGLMISALVFLGCVICFLIGFLLNKR